MKRISGVKADQLSCLCEQTFPIPEMSSIISIIAGKVQVVQCEPERGEAKLIKPLKMERAVHVPKTKQRSRTQVLHF